MNRLFPIALLCLSAFAAAGAPDPAASPGDCISFRNGDSLFGQLVGVQTGDVVRWQSADADGPIDFKPDDIEQIDFATRPLKASHASDTCKLWLANGDRLFGNLVSCDADTLVLDTWYAGKLKISRRSLQTLAFNPRSPTLFDGLTGLDGWTEGAPIKGLEEDGGVWTYRNGAFYANKSASIARDVKLPDRADLQFDIAWRGQLGLSLALYTDSLQPISLGDKERENGPDFGAFYSLRFFQSSVNLTPVRKKGEIHALGDYLFVQALTQKDRIHVDVRMSRPDHRVALLLDGALVRDWKDPGEFAAGGTGIRFVNNALSTVKISNFRVSKWNGVLDDPDSDQPDPSHDVVSLESGGKSSGAVASIANGRINLLTTGGPASIPLDQVCSVEFAPFQGQAPSAPEPNTHATFVQGGSLTFDLTGWRPEGVTAASPDFGRATFDPAAFSRLQFLAPAPKPAAAP